MLLMFCYILLVGRGSSVSIATRYGPDGPGIESRWGRDFPHPSRPAIEPIQSPIQWIPRLFPGGKAAGSCRWSPIPSSAEVKERVELYPYSLSGSSWPVIRWIVPLPFTFRINWWVYSVYRNYSNWFLELRSLVWSDSVTRPSVPIPDD